jgi:hypothetical protein
VKLCKLCKKEIVYRSYDSPGRFATRIYCSRSCAIKDRNTYRDQECGPGMLRCSGCKEVKDRELFFVDRRDRSGRSCYCRDCTTARQHDALRAGKIQAKDAVSYAVKQGVILAAREYLCVACGAQAQVHHHQSYAASERLNVVPLCKRCHSLLHRNDDRSIESHFGVVVTRTGTIRIAIAG